MERRDKIEFLKEFQAGKATVKDLPKEAIIFDVHQVDNDTVLEWLDDGEEQMSQEEYLKRRERLMSKGYFENIPIHGKNTLVFFTLKKISDEPQSKN